MLRIARREKVDFVLLGGDLFHENKPSRTCLYRVLSLLRKYALGSGDVNFRILSDQSRNFPNFGLVNYEDPNFNVELPIFSIHGNHDDPTRDSCSLQSLAALDLLSAANMINYFGKSEKVDHIEVFPILLQKHNTKIAIYGLGNMRDERLNRMFAQRHVKFIRPSEHQSDWFNIFVVHQNRENRGRGLKNCVAESFIPEFIDFVIWGHEHECLIELEESMKGHFYITQPGSSVATSLIEGESREKKVAVLEVKGNNFRMSNHPLKTVRPFIMEDVILSEELDINEDDLTESVDLTMQINKLLTNKVNAILKKYHQQKTTCTYNEILIRLRVEHTGFPLLNNQRFGSKFVGKVANPNDILLFHRRKKQTSNTGSASAKNSLTDVLSGDPIRPVRLDRFCIEDLIVAKLGQSDKKLSLLPETQLNEALENYVHKNIPSALSEAVETILEQTQSQLNKQQSNGISSGTSSNAKIAKNVQEEIHTSVGKNIERIRAQNLLKADQAAMELDPNDDGTGTRVSDGFKKSTKSSVDVNDELFELEAEEEVEVPKKKKTPNARLAKTGKGRSSVGKYTRKSKQVEHFDSSSSSEDGYEAPQGSKRKRAKSGWKNSESGSDFSPDEELIVDPKPRQLTTRSRRAKKANPQQSVANIFSSQVKGKTSTNQFLNRKKRESLKPRHKFLDEDDEIEDVNSDQHITAAKHNNENDDDDMDITQLTNTTQSTQSTGRRRLPLSMTQSSQTGSTKSRLKSKAPINTIARNWGNKRKT